VRAHEPAPSRVEGIDFGIAPHRRLPRAKFDVIAQMQKEGLIRMRG
jgi:hypothetical protein